LAVQTDSYKHYQCNLADRQHGARTLRGIRSRLALKAEGLARVSKNAERRPRVATVAFDGRLMGLVL